jgi:hypothetical protein
LAIFFRSAYTACNPATSFRRANATTKGAISTMSVDHDISPAVRKNSELPFERMRVIQNLDELQVANIQRAVVFVFAIWSGPALTGLRRLTRLLANLDIGSLDVIILDNDCMSADEMIRTFGHVFHGAGEVIWIQDSRVVAELSAFRPESEPQILAHTRDLLNDRAD